MEIIKGSAYEAWKEALKMINEKGEETDDKEKRISKELINLSLTIKQPEQGITKPIESMKELKKWVYPELEELENIFFKKETSSFYYYNYGSRIFNYKNSKNQVDEFIIPLLKKDPCSRRAVIIIYDPLIDSKTEKNETPGLISIFFKIKNNNLTATSIIRSNDILIGWPANIYQIFLLQKYVANILGISLGSLTTISHSAHVFNEYKEELQAILRKKWRKPYGLLDNKSNVSAPLNIFNAASKKHNIYKPKKPSKERIFQTIK